MNDHNVTIRHYDDNSISIHARKDTERRPEFFRKWALSRPDVNSTVHEYAREGRITSIEFFLEDLSKSEAGQVKDLLIRSRERIGYNILNGK